MKSYVKGWNKFHFFIAPDEFETIIKPFREAANKGDY
jgi:hypothetical protein